MSKIFICYRRGVEEKTFAVTLLCEKLTQEFGSKNVFRDIDNIPPAMKWQEFLADAVNRCDVLLAAIDNNWLTHQDSAGKRRLDKIDDWVRFEIETAIDRGIPIVPVLIGDAKLPNNDHLPESIKSLIDWQAVKFRADSFKHDIAPLINRLKEIFERQSNYKKACSGIYKLIADGDWEGALRLATDACTEAGPARFGSIGELQLYLNRAKILTLTSDAFKDAAFARATSILSELSWDDAPKCVQTARRVAEIGARMAQLEGLADVQKLAQATSALDALEPASVVGEAVSNGIRKIREILFQRQRELTYMEALSHYDAGQIAEAAKKMAEVGDYKDAPARLEDCMIWGDVLNCIHQKAWLKAKARLNNLSCHEELNRKREVRRYCILAAKIFPVLNEMAREGGVAEPLALWEGGMSPYAVLGVPPGTPHKQAIELDFRFQEQQGGATLEQRQSCDALRRAEKRLLVDFGLYAVRDLSRTSGTINNFFTLSATDSLAEVLDKIKTILSICKKNTLIDGIANRLGEDAGVMFALMRNHDMAIEHFLAVALDQPWDFVAIHHLGLAASARAHAGMEDDVIGADGTGANNAWNLASTAFAGIFADDRFWRSWWCHREKLYSVAGDDQIQSARSQLQRFWLEELKAISELTTGNTPSAADNFLIELAGARAVACLRGIPVVKSNASKMNVILGPRGIAELQLVPRLQAWVATFPREEVSRPGPHLDVCIAFSHLAGAKMLMEDKRFDEALQALGSLTLGEQKQLGNDNPGFSALGEESGTRLYHETHVRLLQAAYCALATEAVTRFPVDVDQAIMLWERALASGQTKQLRLETGKEIRSTVTGRVQALQQVSDEKQLDALNDAVKLSGEALDRNWDCTERCLRHTHVEALLCRAAYLSDRFDNEEEARRDCLEAYGLAPDSLQVTLALCKYSLYYAKDLTHEGKRVRAQALIGEVEERINEAEERFPSNGDLETRRQWLNTCRKALAGTSPEAITKMMAEWRDNAKVAGREDYNRRLAEAIHAEAQSDFKRATECYWLLLTDYPAKDTELRGKMCYCYRTWLFELCEEKEEFDTVLERAKVRCPPDSAALADIIQSVKQA